jgi:hypothetical protein
MRTTASTCRRPTTLWQPTCSACGKVRAQGREPYRESDPVSSLMMPFRWARRLVTCRVDSRARELSTFRCSLVAIVRGSGPSRGAAGYANPDPPLHPAQHQVVMGARGEWGRPEGARSGVQKVLTWRLRCLGEIMWTYRTRRRCSRTTPRNRSSSCCPAITASLRMRRQSP